MNMDYCICNRVATVGLVYIFKSNAYSDSYCRSCWNSHKRGEEKMTPTHVRLKTGKKVYVERYEGGTIVVKGKNGRVHGTYERTDMPKFHKRYRSLVAKRQTDSIE